MTGALFGAAVGFVSAGAGLFVRYILEEMCKGVLFGSIIFAIIFGTEWVFEEADNQEIMERIRYDIIKELSSHLEDCEKKRLMLPRPQIEQDV